MNKMQFISDRESLAQQFVYQTQKESSYLLSSRASRRRIVYQQSLDLAEQQINDFKQEIQQRYVQSIINKIYTFPFQYKSMDMFNDYQFKQLQGQVQINLYEQKNKQLNPNNFKIMNKKLKNDKVNNILKHIKTLKQDIMNRTLYKQQSIYQNNTTRKSNPNFSKNKTKSIQKSGRNKAIIQKTYRQEDANENTNFNKRLNTQPYQKMHGFIVKKK